MLLEKKVSFASFLALQVTVLSVSCNLDETQSSLYSSNSATKLNLVQITVLESETNYVKAKEIAPYSAVRPLQNKNDSEP